MHSLKQICLKVNIPRSWNTGLLLHTSMYDPVHKQTFKTWNSCYQGRHGPPRLGVHGLYNSSPWPRLGAKGYPDPPQTCTARLYPASRLRGPSPARPRGRRWRPLRQTRSRPSPASLPLGAFRPGSAGASRGRTGGRGATEVRPRRPWSGALLTQIRAATDDPLALAPGPPLWSPKLPSRGSPSHPHLHLHE